jgi:hypothetical protein
VLSYERDARFAPGDEKTIPRSVADVYKSIQNDLIYASDNLSPIAAQRKSYKWCSFCFIGKPIYTSMTKQLLLIN